MVQSKGGPVPPNLKGYAVRAVTSQRQSPRAFRLFRFDCCRLEIDVGSPGPLVVLEGLYDPRIVWCDSINLHYFSKRNDCARRLVFVTASSSIPMLHQLS